MAVLLLAQAGAPFTTGLWAKVQVVFAAVEAGDVPLGVIAMVTAVVAAYFYLRVAVLMYAGGGLGEAEGGTRRLGRAGRRGRHGRRRHDRGGHRRDGAAAGRRRQWATPAAAAGAVTTLNEQILLADEDAERRRRRHAEPVPVPVLSGLAIALCTGVTVLFGVWPQPLIDFANHATLLFLPK